MRTRRWRGREVTRVAAAAMLCGSIGAAAIAAETPEPRPEDGAARSEAALFADPPTVISASRYEQGINEAPASISVVTADEIRRYGYRTLADVLRNTRGFYVSYDRNYEFAGVRGFGRPGDYSNRLLVMVNGHPHNSRWLGSSLIGHDLGIDLDLVERIEIVRGPASALYGSNALLAVINVITREAQDLAGLQANVAGGSFGTGGAGVSFGRSFGDRRGLVLGISAFGSGGQDLFYPEFDAPATNFGVAEGGDGEMAGGLFASLRHGDWTFDAKVARRRKHFPTAAFNTDFNDDGNYTADARHFVEARHEHLTAGGAFSSTRLYVDRHAYYGDYIYGGVVNRDEGGADWAGAEYRFSLPAGRGQRFVAGAQYEYSFSLYQRNYDEGTPVVQYLDQEFGSFRYSLYVQDEIAVGRRVLLNLGVRHDQDQRFGGSTNPRVAVIWSPRRSTTLKFLYGSAFRVPSIYEAYYDDGGYSIKPNPALRSEEIDTAEIVWEQGLGRRSALVASMYRYVIDDLISQFTDPSDSLVQYLNLETVEAKGIELEFSGRTPGGLSLRAAYARQQAHVRYDTPLTNSPKHLGQASLGIPLLRQRAEIGLQARYLSPRVTLSGRHTRASVVTDVVFSSGTVWKALELSAGVRNLLDRDYGDPGGNEHAQDEIPQDRRSWFLILRHRF